METYYFIQIYHFEESNLTYALKSIFCCLLCSFLDRNHTKSTKKHKSLIKRMMLKEKHMQKIIIKPTLN
jgi:hypothetical protein